MGPSFSTMLSNRSLTQRWTRSQVKLIQCCIPILLFFSLWFLLLCRLDVSASLTLRQWLLPEEPLVEPSLSGALTVLTSLILTKRADTSTDITSYLVYLSGRNGLATNLHLFYSQAKCRPPNSTRSGRVTNGLFKKAALHHPVVCCCPEYNFYADVLDPIKR